MTIGVPLLLCAILVLMWFSGPLDACFVRGLALRSRGLRYCSTAGCATYGLLPWAFIGLCLGWRFVPIWCIVYEPLILFVG